MVSRICEEWWSKRLILFCPRRKNRKVHYHVNNCTNILLLGPTSWRVDSLPRVVTDWRPGLQLMAFGSHPRSKLQWPHLEQHNYRRQIGNFLWNKRMAGPARFILMTSNWKAFRVIYSYYPLIKLFYFMLELLWERDTQQRKGKRESSCFRTCKSLV